MKAKTIKKVIEQKLKDWSDSVSDPDIKEIIENNVIVTGGCIASMLLKQDVNDFDVYLDSKEAVKKISQYYKKGFSNLDLIDGSDYEDLQKELEDSTHHSQFQRCVYGIDESRIKFFIKDTGILKVEVSNDDENANKFLPVFFSANAITLTDKLQIVIRFHGDADKIHENYDFVHATNYYYSGDKKLHLSKEALEALLTQELQYIGSKYPLTSIIRTKKFILRGYSISAGTYLKIMYQISKLDLDDLSVLEDQLAGVDVAYFDMLIEALKSMKDKGQELSYGYLCSIIDKIFND